MAKFACIDPIWVNLDRITMVYPPNDFEDSAQIFFAGERHPMIISRAEWEKLRAVMEGEHAKDDE